MNMHRALGLACWLVAVASLPAGDWTRFRGNDGTGVSAETGLPIKWSASANIRWQADLPGRGLSCPVIAGGRVYITASSRHDQSRLHVLCFDLAGGKKLWERQFWATGDTTSNEATCMAAPTPVTDGKQVFALFATGDLVCLDADGNLQWYRSLVGDYPTITNQVGMAASLVLWKDVLIVPMQNMGESFVAGLDKATGKNRWKEALPRDINWTTPLVITSGEQTSVLFQSGQELAAYDPLTGSKRWNYTAAGMSTIPSPAPANGLVLVAAGELTALRPGGDRPQVVWKNNKLRPSGYGTPLLYQGRVYSIGSVGLNCGDAATGNLLWQQRAKGPFAASPVAGDGKIYLVNEDGIATVILAGDKPNVLSTNPLGEKISATPAFADGAIFLRSDQHLFCIGEKKIR